MIRSRLSQDQQPRLIWSRTIAQGGIRPPSSVPTLIVTVVSAIVVIDATSLGNIFVIGTIDHELEDDIQFCSTSSTTV